MTEAKRQAHKRWRESEQGKAYYVANRKEKSAKRRDLRIQRRKWLDDYRSTLICSQCPEKHPSCMEFHHTNDNKEFQIGSSTTRDIPIERIKKEIAKCIVLCSNCHKKLHWAKRQTTEQ